MLTIPESAMLLKRKVTKDKKERKQEREDTKVGTWASPKVWAKRPKK